MKHIYTLLTIIGLAQPIAYSQNYSIYDTEVPGFSQGGTSWGDFDHDGFVDLVVNGLSDNGESATLVYRNNSGQLVLFASLPGYFNGSVMWGDMDNDDDLDLLVCGADNSWNGNTAIFCNDDGVFNQLPSAISGIASGRALWLDFNNDNFLDIMITGDSLYYNPSTKLYKNEGNGTFSPVISPFAPMLQSFAAAGDFDNDGDQDVLLSGDDGYGLFSTILYRNDHSLFVETSLFFAGVYSGDGLFLDYDKDRDLDIIYMGGIHGGLYIFKIYVNNGDGTFTEKANSIEGEWVGKIETADLNLDGFPDLGVTGSLCCGDALTAFYLNDGQGNFNHLPFDLPPLTFSQISFADIDNDGDSDFVLTGLPPEVGSLPITRIFRNQANSNLFIENTRPEPPHQLECLITGNSVQFHFQPPLTNLGGEAGYTYNLRIGSQPGGSDIFSGLSNPETGFIKLFKPGNIGQNLSWTTHNLLDGTYYWSVQTIDIAGYSSYFASEQTFSIVTTQVSQETLFPNLSIHLSNFNNELYISSGKPFYVNITDIQGKPVFTSSDLQNRLIIDATSLSPGIYVVTLSDGLFFESRKVIRN